MNYGFHPVFKGKLKFYYMPKFKRHMSINLEGMLRNYGKKKINIFEDEDGKIISDKEARIYIQQCLSKGWKVIPMGGNDCCEGFDYSGGGCPGHEVKDDAA